MPHFVSTKDEDVSIRYRCFHVTGLLNSSETIFRIVWQVQDMNDIASDFACLKVSALKKASRICGAVKKITIGPNSTANENESEKSNNIENEQNSCNISIPQKSVCSQNKTSTQSGVTFSVKKILVESEYQRKEKVRVMGV